MILDIIYGDEGEGNGINTISQTAQRLRNPGQKRLRKASTESMLNLAFWAILLYVCFAFLPLWAAISLIGIKLAIPVAKVIKYITVAKKLVNDDKNINKKLLSIRLKIANKEK